MIKISELKEMLECSILTGIIKNKHNNTSLFFIAKPESGKSEVISLSRDYESVIYTNDLSFAGLIKNIIPQIQNDRLSHIAIPDFINVLSHRRASETLTPVLNSLMAEGVKDLKFYGVENTYPYPIKAGFVTGITKEMFDTRIQTWKNIGFLTRMIVVTYSYSETTRLQIHNYIKDGDSFERDKTQASLYEKFRLNSIDVTIPSEIAVQVQILATALTNQNAIYTMQGRTGRAWKMDLKGYGFRLHHQLRTLIQGICLYNGKGVRFEVDETDFNKLQSFTKFMNFNFTEL